MNILIGLICGLVFFIALLAAFYGGYRLGKKTKAEVPELTEEQLNKAKLMAEGWQNILNYDVNVAMKRGDNY